MRGTVESLKPSLALVLALGACSRPPAGDTSATHTAAPAPPTASATPSAASSPTFRITTRAPQASSDPRPDAGPPAIYGTHASIPLTLAAHGFDGSLRVLEDTRARKPAEHMVPMRVDDRYLHARLEILDPGGRPVAAEELWTALADVRPAGDLHGVFFLELDPECFASRFCGKDTEMRDVSAGKLQGVESVEAEGGQAKPIVLRRSIMEDWRLSPADGGQGFEIFQVVSTSRATAYVRYTREGSRWIKRYKQHQGEDPPGNPGNEELAFDRKNFPALPRGQ